MLYVFATFHRSCLAMCDLHRVCLFIYILWYRNEGPDKDYLGSHCPTAEQLRGQTLELVSVIQKGFGLPIDSAGRGLQTLGGCMGNKVEFLPCTVEAS